MVDPKSDSGRSGEPPGLIDTHCHLDVEELAPDRGEVIRRSRAVGVRAIVVPGIRRVGWPGLVALCDSEPDLFPALGLHPVYLDEHSPDDLTALERAIADARPVAIGEIGLDYWVRELDRDRQQALFEAQLELARAADLPVLLHVRKAHERVLATLERIRVRGGIAHAFGGGIEEARRYRDLGFALGFGGMLTFERSRKLRALAAAVPLDCIVLETDAPDLTVAAHQGGRNSPEYLPDVLRALSEIRGEGPEWLARCTSANASALLGLPEL